MPYPGYRVRVAHILAVTTPAWPAQDMSSVLQCNEWESSFCSVCKRVCQSHLAWRVPTRHTRLTTCGSITEGVRRLHRWRGLAPWLFWSRCVTPRRLRTIWLVSGLFFFFFFFFAKLVSWKEDEQGQNISKWPTKLPARRTRFPARDSRRHDQLQVRQSVTGLVHSHQHLPDQRCRSRAQTNATAMMSKQQATNTVEQHLGHLRQDVKRSHEHPEQRMNTIADGGIQNVADSLRRPSSQTSVSQKDQYDNRSRSFLCAKHNKIGASAISAFASSTYKPWLQWTCIMVHGSPIRGWEGSYDHLCNFSSLCNSSSHPLPICHSSF